MKHSETMEKSFFGRKTGLLFCFLLMAVLFLAPGTAQAAKYKSVWSTVKGKSYYYNEKGKKATSVTVIGKRTYYFTEKGVQRVGWQEIKGKYYYFRPTFGKGGYLSKNTTVSGVKLGKKGAAVLTSRTRRKVKLFVRCQEIVQKLTNADDTKAEKLKAVFEYTRDLTPRNIHSFRSSGDWDMYYAEYMLNHGYGDCYCYAAVFGYLANAVGYSNVKIESSGGHGWVHIGNYYYDPNWERVMGGGKCYAVPSSLSGKGGRPRWSVNANYVKNVSQ